MSDRLTPVRNALADLELALQDATSVFGDDLPEDVRWRLHVLACDLSDYTFWVQKIGDGWKATEVETGVSGDICATPQDALASYWAGPAR